MKTKRFEIKREWFQEILEGRQKYECREVDFAKEEEFVRYKAGGRFYTRQIYIPEGLEFEPIPVEYDRLELVTGARGAGGRPYMLVEVLGLAAKVETDELGRRLYSPNDDHKKIWMILVEYRLGRILKKGFR